MILKKIFEHKKGTFSKIERQLFNRLLLGSDDVAVARRREANALGGGGMIQRNPVLPHSTLIGCFSTAGKKMHFNAEASR